MKIKSKLRLGFGFLFLMVIGFGAVSLFYMNEISVSSKVILKDNYKSLRYVRNIRSILDERTLPLNPAAKNDLWKQLRLEEENITEAGEQDAVSGLDRSIRKISDENAGLPEKQAALKMARLQLKTIEGINMNAIVRKNDRAQEKIETAATYLVAAASFCFLILFSFVVNFPGFVANPLREFSAALKEIARKNYKQRLQFKGSDEFAELATEFNSMASQLNKWENSNLAKIQSEKLRIEAIIEQMQDAIIGFNEHKEVLFLNKVAGQLFNLDKSQAVGLSSKNLETKNDLFARVMQTENGSKPLKIYADEKESYFQVERRKITSPEFENSGETAIAQTGRAAGEVYILRNITQYKELDEAKTNFIATVSHELKTPIASIKMSLKLIDDERVGGLNPEQKELVGHIKEDCGRLLKITGELLDLAQVETGNIQLNFTLTDPKKIAIYAIDAVRFQAAQKSIEIDLECKASMPKVFLDVEKTAWVLINFLSNALRYGPSKSKVLLQVAEKGAYIEFSVRDFGKGIEEQYQKRLFERYFQVPTDGNNKSGSGLGLAISKDFIEAENGKIWVESALGEGSRFCFLIPVAKG